MIIVLPTIMHTGNTLMQEIIGYEVIGCAQEPRSDDTVIHAHTTNSLYDQLEKCMDKYPSIIPMRHPARVWRSFQQRDSGKTMKTYREQFGCMVELTEGRNVSYIHVDQPELRDTELDQASRRLGINNKTAWPIVNSVAGTHELDITNDMVAEIPEWILEYYKRTYN